MKPLLTLLSLALFLFQPSFASQENPSVLVLGKISHNPNKHYASLKPMADYVASQLTELGIKEIKIRLAKSQRQLTQWMKNGDIDWVTETPFATSILMAEADAEPLLLKEKKGVAEYYSIIFVRNDSKILQLSDLKGKIIALEDPASTSAFYLPAGILLEHGLQLKKLSNASQTVGKNQVGFVFAGEEITISTWLEKNRVAAGAFSNQDWQKEDHLPPKYQQQFRILAQSAHYPRAIETVRTKLPAKLKQAIKQILLNAKNSNAGQSALWAYQRSSGFQSLSKNQISQLKQYHPTAVSIKKALELDF